MGNKRRRTGTGSPLGEVVDHGCDAFSACAYATILCDAFAFDARTNRLLVCVITSCARWNFGLDTVDEHVSRVVADKRFPTLARDSDHMPDYVFAHGVSRAERLECVQCSCA